MQYEIKSGSYSKLGVFRPDGDGVIHMPRPGDKPNLVFVENSESASQTALPLTFHIMRVQMTTHCKVLLSLSVPSRKIKTVGNEHSLQLSLKDVFFSFFLIILNIHLPHRLVFI